MFLPQLTPNAFNEKAHNQIKLLMRQKRILNIRLDESFALISTQAITGIQYLLTENSWKWMVNYLKTGDYEDFGVFTSSAISDNDFQLVSLKRLIESGENIARVPFIRETQAFVKLRALFKYGKLFFSIRRTDDFMDYLNSKGL